MANGFLGRMAKKWWLMLVLGIVIGLGVGLPLGRTLPSEKLLGTTFPRDDLWVDKTVSEGEQFTVKPGGLSILESYNTRAFSLLETAGRNKYGNPEVYVFKVKQIASPETITFAIWQESGRPVKKFYRITLDPPANPNPPDPMIIYRAFAFPKTFGDQLEIGKDDDAYLVGELVLFPWNRSTIGFLKSNGAVLTIDRYMTLFSTLGSTYGGDGKTTFAVPDLTRESPVSGLTYHIAPEGLYPHLRDRPNAGAGDGIKYFAFEGDGLYGAMGEVVLGKNLDERYLPADGRELDINEYRPQFELIGTAFGGNGQTTFKLPDLSGAKSPVVGAKYYIRVWGNFPSFK